MGDEYANCTNELNESPAGLLGKQKNFMNSYTIYCTARGITRVRSIYINIVFLLTRPTISFMMPDFPCTSVSTILTKHWDYKLPLCNMCITALMNSI